MFKIIKNLGQQPPWDQMPEKNTNGILLKKLFWPTMRKKCSSDREMLLKLEAEGGEFAKFWDH